MTDATDLSKLSGVELSARLVHAIGAVGEGKPFERVWRPPNKNGWWMRGSKPWDCEMVDLTTRDNLGRLVEIVTPHMDKSDPYWSASRCDWDLPARGPHWVVCYADREHDHQDNLGRALAEAVVRAMEVKDG